MKVSDYIAAFIHRQGISVVFEMAGGMITHMLDSIAKYQDIKIVSMHHEQSASFAADAFGRATGRPGIALATSGPGATNLLTGIGSCYFDSSPAIFITGQVNLHEQKGDLKIRQLGFQETDIASMAAPITKAVYKITDPNQIESVLEDAFMLAISGRPGPVLVDIPMNIQRAEIETTSIEYLQKNNVSFPSEEIFEDILNSIRNSKKPIVLAGGGIRVSGSQEIFENLIKRTELPTITSLLGIDAIPRTNSNNIGFLGAYGNRWSNLAVGDSDLILVLGSRLDIRQTGADTAFFQSKKIIHVDCEVGELNNRLKNCQAVQADLQPFLTGLLAYITKTGFSVDFSDWKNNIQALKDKWPDTQELASIKGINPNVFMRKISKKASQIRAWITDVGNHQMWAAQSLELQEGQRFITSGGMGAMGFSLPAGIGASFALNGPVAVIAGDGGFQLNIQELQTVQRNNLPLKMIVMNNQNLGMIRQFQDSYFDSRYQSTFWGYSAPDFEKVAEAYGINARTIKEEEEVDAMVEWIMNDDSQPKLLQVMIDSYANAYPKIAFGKPLTEMEPFAKPIAMEAT